MKRIILSLLFLATITGFAHPTFADPAPFGLEIGKATVADAEKMYSIKRSLYIGATGEQLYDVDVNQVNFEGLKELVLYFNENSVLTHISAKLPKSQFKSIHESLSKKYKVSKEFVNGSDFDVVTYEDGSTRITLGKSQDPEHNHDMFLEYMFKGYGYTAKKKSQEDRL